MSYETSDTPGLVVQRVQRDLLASVMRRYMMNQITMEAFLEIWNTLTATTKTPKPFLPSRKKSIQETDDAITQILTNLDVLDGMYDLPDRFATLEDENNQSLFRYMNRALLLLESNASLIPSRRQVSFRWRMLAAALLITALVIFYITWPSLAASLSLPQGLWHTLPPFLLPPIIAIPLTLHVLFTHTKQDFERHRFAPFASHEQMLAIRDATPQFEPVHAGEVFPDMGKADSLPQFNDMFTEDEPPRFDLKEFFTQSPSVFSLAILMIVLLAMAPLFLVYCLFPEFESQKEIAWPRTIKLAAGGQN